MLATLGGTLALAIGVAVLLLPLLVSELSRPRDAVWGGVVLLLGLVLVTCADRLTGAPMLAVLCGGLLIGRLGSEVGLGRWRQLTEEERQRLGSAERWRSGLSQLGASLSGLLRIGTGGAAGIGAWLQERRQPRRRGKKWVRPEAAPEPAESPELVAPVAKEPAVEAAEEAAENASVAVVADFTEIDARLEAAEAAGGEAQEEPTGEAG